MALAEVAGKVEGGSSEMSDMLQLVAEDSQKPTYFQARMLVCRQTLRQAEACRTQV